MFSASFAFPEIAAESTLNRSSVAKMQAILSYVIGYDEVILTVTYSAI